MKGQGMSRAWTIKRKLTWLTLVFGIAVVLSFLISAGTILVYLRPALERARQYVSIQREVTGIQSLIREQELAFQEAPHFDGGFHAVFEQHRAMLLRMKRSRAVLSSAGLGHDWGDIERLMARSSTAVERLARTDQTTQGINDRIEEAHAALMSLAAAWQQISRSMQQQRNRSIGHATALHNRVVIFLVASAAICLGIGLAGVLLINRWMVGPLGALEHATAAFARGDTTYCPPELSADEIGELGDALAEMAARIGELQLQRLNAARRDAAWSNVNELQHLLKAPLERIKQLAEEGVRDAGGDEELLASHSTTLQAVVQFERWVGQMRESMSLSEPMPCTFEPQRLIEEVQAALETMVRRYGVRLEIAVSPMVGSVEADRTQVEYALFALVANAVEVSRPEQAVRISATCASKDAEVWDLSVQDEGPGIPRDILSDVSRPFFTTKPDGSGMGLLLVNIVAAAHGGRLIIESQEGSGSCFTLRLPTRPNLS